MTKGDMKQLQRDTTWLQLDANNYKDLLNAHKEIQYDNEEW